MKQFFKKVLIGILSIVTPLANMPINAFAASSGDSYVYLSDITSKVVSKSVAYSEFYQDRNEPGNLISLLINGEKTYFLKGVFAHAPSTVVYNISEYTAKGYDTFSAYLGVDSYAGSVGNGVKFTISVSEDNVTWKEIKTTSVLKGDSSINEKVTLSIKGYNYLKLYANNNGDDQKDHAVYADAMIYNSNEYAPKTVTSYDWIKKVADYDATLIDKTDFLTNNETRLTLLQRTLVSRIDYSVLQAWLNSSSENEEILNWLFNDVNILEEYILGGTPEGGSYTKSLDVLAKIYNKHKDDVIGNDIKSKTLRKVMFATSLTHASTVQSWFSGANGAKVYSTGLGRYETIKELYLGAKNGEYWKQRLNDGTRIPYTFEVDQFEDLSIEEMRWVTINNMSDEEFLYLNWYATATKLGYTDYSSMMPSTLRERNPYLYIEYGDGGNVGKDEYYVANPMCGVGNEFYDPNKRTVSCYEKYQLNDWEGLQTHEKSKPTLWIAFEEDGVCGTLMHVGNNLQRVFGIPASGLGQPGHGAYIYADRVLNSETGHYYTRQWTTYNWVSGWDQSEKGERLLLDWGTRNSKTVFNSTYNLIYIPLAQQALNTFDKYRDSELYMMMADVQTSASGKEKYYKLALDEIPYHIKAWYNLLTLKVNNNASSTELDTLGKKMMNAVGNAPTAIDELSNIIENRLGDEFSSFKLEQGRILKELETTKDTKYMNVSGVNEVARRLLGTVDNLEVASFSFNDSILKLLGSYANNNATFEYALDYSYDPNTETVSATWQRVSGTSIKLTEEIISNMNSTNDIAIHIMGDFNYKPSNIYFIDITDGKTPTGLYANDLENRVIGVTNSMEWKIKDTGAIARIANANEWTKFSDAQPDLTGTKTILIRDGAHDQTLASQSVEFLFNLDPEYDPTKSYISIDRLSATASTQQNNSDQKASLAIDGNPNTFWHNAWSGADKDRWIKIEVTDGPVEISKIDYVPRPGGGNGNYTKVKIEVSLDGNTWDTIETSYNWGGGTGMKTYYFETPALAKYVRLTAVESVGSFASAAMINLYENKTPHTVSVNNLSVSYMTSGFIYNGQEKTPNVTVRYEDKDLILGEDYKIEYQNNINAGTAKIILTGLGIYEGTLELPFEISKSPEYLGTLPAQGLCAEITQKTLADISLPDGWIWEDSSIKLVPGQTITANAIYNGPDKDNYEEIKISISIAQDRGNRPNITIQEDAKLSFDIANDRVENLDYFKSILNISDVEDDSANKTLKIELNKELTDWDGNWDKEGTYHVTFTITDSDGNSVDYTIEFTLFNSKTPEIEINKNDFTFKIEDVYYTGSELTPAVDIYDNDGHKLKLGTDYEIVEYNNNTNAGKATVTIKGIGLYTGEFTLEFSINKSDKPEVVPDTNITVSSDTTSLGDINLPEGWHWADENVELHDGENQITIIYTGDENHESITMTITIVKESNTNDSGSNTPNNPGSGDNENDKDKEDQGENTGTGPGEQNPDQPNPPVDKPKDEENGDNPSNNDDNKTPDAILPENPNTNPDNDKDANNNNNDMPQTGVVNISHILTAIGLFFVGLFTFFKNKFRKNEE